ncbi:DNA ligase [Desulfosarcina sp. OttesenSCG-928-A07]|nr:DNA ligase [Desulfosarcina sp. OttesenSCG-928-G17]MDL2328631.1 DNA ligase [Desulfosarcina sp. OttesenSCG-928-A07]
MIRKGFYFFSAAGWLFFLLAGISFAQPVSLQQPGVYQGKESVSGWLMSEKYDGIRGYWTGTTLVTRTGNKIHAPEWFTKDFPAFALDGELWRKRNDFSFVQSTVQDTVPSDNWAEITYQIFDVPTAPGDFLSRLEMARKWFETHPASHVQIIPQQICTGPAHVRAFLESVVARGGEGVVLRHPTMAPHSGRSPYLLKVKPFSEMDGVVIGHTPGKGKFSGMTGSLVVRLEDGVTFKLGTGLTLSQRRHPPPVGSVITFKYQDLTKNGIPRFASFLHERR